LKENTIMPEEVTFDAKRQLICVRSWGECGIQDWNSSKDQVLQLNSKHGCNKLLVDVREQEAAPGTMEIFKFGASWPLSIRVAILVGKGTQEDQKFLETVAVNRGIPMKDFMEEDEAIEWLNR
tara:strand:- start:164 stop:532 length:369 start_codon:yes stop_codon:yes gene_type:complete